jgi:hypothetical protein
MMCRYLPLQQDGHHVKGMTVYTSYYGTSSIILHGGNSDVVVSTPNRRGSPISFYFSEGEEIVTIGLVIIGFYDAQFGPYLMVMHCPFPYNWCGFEEVIIYADERTFSFKSLVQDESTAARIFRTPVTALGFLCEIYALNTRSPKT